MNRRELLKKGSIAGLLSLLPATNLLAEVAKPIVQTAKNHWQVTRKYNWEH